MKPSRLSDVKLAALVVLFACAALLVVMWLITEQWR